MLSSAVAKLVVTPRPPAPLLAAIAVLGWLACVIVPGILNRPRPAFIPPSPTARPLDHVVRAGVAVFNSDMPLQSSAGAQMSLAATAGRVRVVSMIYTHCPDRCPLTVQQLRLLEHSLTPVQRARLQFVLLTLDPVNDSPAMLTTFAKRQGISSSGWLLARTSAGDAVRLSAAIGDRPRTSTDGHIEHSPSVALVAEDGRVLESMHVADGLQASFVHSVQRAIGR